MQGPLYIARIHQACNAEGVTPIPQAVPFKMSNAATRVGYKVFICIAPGSSSNGYFPQRYYMIGLMKTRTVRDKYTYIS